MGKGDMQGASQEKLRRDRGIASGATNSDPFGLIKCPHCDALLRRASAESFSQKNTERAVHSWSRDETPVPVPSNAAASLHRRTGRASQLAKHFIYPFRVMK